MVAPGVKRLVIRPEVEAELAEAVEWYEARGKGLGADLLRAVDSAIASIVRHPEMYPVVFEDARRAVLRRFPNNLVYTASHDEIVIVACAHGRRDPRRW